MWDPTRYGAAPPGAPPNAWGVFETPHPSPVPPAMGDHYSGIAWSNPYPAAWRPVQSPPTPPVPVPEGHVLQFASAGLTLPLCYMMRCADAAGILHD